MEKKRVFLAFSNAADQEDLIYIKSLLKKYNVEIVQFENGNYDKILITLCDYVFLVVPRQSTDGNCIFIGRGQYDQIEYIHLGGFLENTFLFYNDFKENKILRIAGYEKHDTNDYKLKYGRLTYVIEARDNHLRFDLPNFFNKKFSLIEDNFGVYSKPLNNRNIKDWLL